MIRPNLVYRRKDFLFSSKPVYWKFTSVGNVRFFYFFFKVKERTLCFVPFGFVSSGNELILRPTPPPGVSDL